MRKQVRKRYDAHVRTSAVCTEHQAIFDATPGGQKARATLGTCVTDTDRLFALQQRLVDDRRAATEQLRAGRSTLRNAIKAVVMVGKLVHLSDTVMGTMRLQNGVSDDELLAYARGLLDRVSPHADAFVAEGLPPDLLQNLEAEVQRFATAKDALAGSRQRFTTASAAIRDTQDQADTTIAALEAIAINTPAAQPEVVNRLRIAKRVGPRVAASAAKPTPAPTTPPSTPSDKAA